MRFQRIIEALYTRPLDITPEGFQTIDAIVRPHLRAGLVKIQDGDFEMGKTDLFGTPLPEMLEEDGDIGVINICGPLIQHAALIDKSCGACSYQDIAAALDRAHRSGLAGILLNINSPGGEHTGCNEVALKIEELADEMEIWAFTDTIMCSAAYCLAASCNRIYSTHTAMVGCIGSIIGFLDTSKAFEMEGLKPVIFASGKYKGTGHDGTVLTAEQSAYLQRLVDESAQLFKEHVQNHREDIQEETMEGQCFYGDKGVEACLVDGLKDDLQDCLDGMRSGKEE